jgi:hypothetical protein
VKRLDAVVVKGFFMEEFIFGIIDEKIEERRVEKGTLVVFFLAFQKFKRWKLGK